MPSATRSSGEPSKIAIDASALVELLLGTRLGRQIRDVVNGTQLIAPDLINPEVLQSLRGLERAGRLTSERAARAAMRLASGPIVRVPTARLIADAWALRANLSAYDALYVALARELGCPLLTTDAPLRRAPAPGVTFLTVR